MPLTDQQYEAWLTRASSIKAWTQFRTLLLSPTLGEHPAPSPREVAAAAGLLIDCLAEIVVGFEVLDARLAALDELACQIQAARARRQRGAQAVHSPASVLLGWETEMREARTAVDASLGTLAILPRGLINREREDEVRRLFCRCRDQLGRVLLTLGNVNAFLAAGAREHPN